VNAERFGCHTPVCAAQVQTTRDYSTKKLDLHDWRDAAVKRFSGELYGDEIAGGRSGAQPLRAP